MPVNYLLITLDIESKYINIDHTKVLQPVRDVIGNYHIYDPIIDPLELSLKANDLLYNDERFIQNVGTSIDNDIIMAKCNVLLKCPLKPYTYFRYLGDIFIIWPHGKEAFTGFLDIV